jgi:hypothetical protein
LKDVDDHSIDREACEEWLGYLNEAAGKFDAWKKKADKASTLFIHAENLSFLPEDKREGFLKKKFDDEKIIAQIEVMVAERTRAFAKYFVDHLQFVPFDEFLDSSKEALQRAIQYGKGTNEHWARREDVNKMLVAELKMRLKSRGLSVEGVKKELVDRLFAALQKRKAKRIVWLNYYAVNRSMSYMMLLLYPEVAEQIDGLCMTFAEVVRYAESLPPDEEVLCLLVDDAAYTGQQLALKLRRFYTSHIAGETESKIEFAVVVPYVSTAAAKELFQDSIYMQVEVFTSRPSKLTTKLSFAGVSEKMRTLEEIIYLDDALETDEKESLMGVVESSFSFVQEPDGQQPFFFRYGSTEVPIVLFGHKLADRVSVPNFLIAQAPYPRLKRRSRTNELGVQIKHMPLFKNADTAKFQFQPYKSKATYEQIQFEDFIQTEENMAPFPPYKKIQFDEYDESSKSSLLSPPS